MRKYLYRKLREYLDLYVRPGDRIAQISAKEIAEPLKFQSHEVLARYEDLGDIFLPVQELKQTLPQLPGVTPKAAKPHRR